jgi:syntaxin 18
MLLSMTSDVTRMERSMREIATLNQMFSTAIAHQSEQIEHIYSQVCPAGVLSSLI